MMRIENRLFSWLQAHTVGREHCEIPPHQYCYWCRRRDLLDTAEWLWCWTATISRTLFVALAVAMPPRLKVCAIEQLTVSLMGTQPSKLDWFACISTPSQDTKSTSSQDTTVFLKFMAEAGSMELRFNASSTDALGWKLFSCTGMLVRSIHPLPLSWGRIL